LAISRLSNRSAKTFFVRAQVAFMKIPQTPQAWRCMPFFGE